MKSVQNFVDNDKCSDESDNYDKNNEEWYELTYFDESRTGSEVGRKIVNGGHLSDGDSNGVNCHVRRSSGESVCEIRTDQWKVISR